MDGSRCIFTDNSQVKCQEDEKAQLSCITFQGVFSIIRCSKERQDLLHPLLNIPEDVDYKSISSYKCHKKCKSTYTSPHHIKRYLRTVTSKSTCSESNSNTPVARTPLRSQLSEFVWKEHCFFCVERCDMIPDPKNPKRWRAAYECHTSDRGARGTFKDAVLRVCDVRNDRWSEDVRTRLSDRRCSYDLHSADARYHDDCRKRFMTPKSVKRTQSKPSAPEDNAFTTLVKTLKEDTSRMWTSIELENCYKEQGGNIFSRYKLVQNVLSYFGDEMIVLSSPGLADILVFRKPASLTMRLQEDENEKAKSDEGSIKRVAKIIVEEIKAMAFDRNVYRKRIDVDIAYEDTSPTLSKLLSCMSPNLSERSLPSVLIGNIITTKVVRRSTPLLVGLGVLVREKKLVEHLYDYGVVCSYDELKLFRSSAAVEGNKSGSGDVLKDHTLGLVQVVGDNFDCLISSPNGLRQTHALAMLLTQQESGEDAIKDDTFPRLKKSSLNDSSLKDVPLVQYHGPKKPEMPMSETKRGVLPLKVLAHMVVILQISKELDFKFLKEVVSTPGTPEYSGFNTCKTREAGRSMFKPTVALYTPLIDLKPSDPTTMLTAMVEAQRITAQTGQKHTIFTADQQLYKVLCDIKWAYPEKFKNLLPRLGGMHFITNFVGCVGVLMQNTGLEDIMKSAFSGVDKMLLGKKFPHNIRALRMVVEELLRGVINDLEVDVDLENLLDDLSSKSKTCKLWVDCLIKPVLLMMLYVRAEREGEWPLHLYAVSHMIPYFFAAGHPNYSRYGSYYIRSMERLPSEVLEQFLKGEHVMRHQPGYWNGIWSDMYIETTFMRYGKGPGGLVGITLNQDSVKKWANGLHIATQIINDLDNMRDRNTTKEKTSHKEEMRSRIASDGEDRAQIRKVLESCVDPLDPSKHPEEIVNVYSGIISTDAVNVHEAVSMGIKQMREFEESWPDGFYKSIKKEVKAMVINKKCTKVKDIEVYNTEIIYARVMGLLSTGQVKLDEVLRYELSPTPMSLFKETGEMRLSKNKSDLKTDLKSLHASCSVRLQANPEAVIVDGSALLWTVHWPSRGTVEDLAKSVLNSITKKIHLCDVYLIFDRYHDFSPKCSTRNERAYSIMHRHQFTLNTPLPAQNVALTSTPNKVQLINIITQYLLKEVSKQILAHKLIVTGSEESPFEVYQEDVKTRTDLRTTHEEGDIIIIQQVFCAVEAGAKIVKVISDDTDVFILLMYFIERYKLEATILMEATHNDRSIININNSVMQHQEIVSSLLPMHALSGCDTVPKLFGIGKKKALNILLNTSFKFSFMGKIDSRPEDIISEATLFIGTCYGVKNLKDMSTIRYKIWRKRTEARKLTSAPKLCSLPPTTEVFEQNVLRAHYQSIMWMSSLSPDPLL